MLSFCGRNSWSGGMDQIEFADGFDRPDQIAFGLGAAQLAVVMGGALAAYALLRSPIAPAFADPMAVVIGSIAAALGWIGFAGRPALDWAVFAGRYIVRARSGTLHCALATPDAPSPVNPGQPVPVEEPPKAPIIELFGVRETRQPEVRTTPAILAHPGRRDGPRRVTFFSLRGGTGRSTLATELACLLAASSGGDRPGLKVALIDLDLRSPTVGIRLGTREKTLLDYALSPPEDRSVADFMVTHTSGARVLLGPQRAVNPEWPVTPALLREVLRELDMDALDLVVVDISPELSPLNIAALSACDDVFVVVVPTAGGVQDAYRSTEALRRLGLRHQLRYIVNRSRPGTDLTEPMADLGGQLIGDIPDDDSVVTAENAHRLVALDESSPAALALRRLARRIGGELSVAWHA
jgi:MinD-like ATPase involved in chromosome partitioning or flagellar assembly